MASIDAVYGLPGLRRRQSKANWKDVNKARAACLPTVPPQCRPAAGWLCGETGEPHLLIMRRDGAPNSVDGRCDYDEEMRGECKRISVG